MSKSKLTTGALRQILMKAIDDVATGDLTEQKAGAIAKLAAQVNNSLLAEIEIMRADIIGKIEGKVLGSLTIGDDEQPAKPMIEHVPQGADLKPQPMSRQDMLSHTAKIIDRRQSGGAVDLGDPAPGRSALDQCNAEQGARAGAA